MDEDERFGCSCSTILFVVLFLAFALGVYYAGALLYKHAEDPQGFAEFVVAKVLGIYMADYEEDDVPSVVEGFDIKYWYGKEVEFWVPDSVMRASIQAGNKYGCDPWLLVAVAFSESTAYNNSEESSAGALGVWQFIWETWKVMWPKIPRPPRTHIQSAANAACRYLKMTGANSAVRSSKEVFVYKFAVEPLVWNRYPPQAAFVYDLYHELRVRDRGSDWAFEESGPIEMNFIRKGIVWVLDQLGLLPEVFKYAGVGGGGDIVAIPEVGSPGKFRMPYNSYSVTQGPHGQNYGHLAVDIKAGKGAVIYAPISGVVTGRGKDSLGSTVLIIENRRYRVTMMHGNFFIPKGNRVNIGAAVGTESNIGNTWSSDGQYCGTGSNCGYHTHLNVFDKKTGRNVYPLNLVGSSSFLGEGVLIGQLTYLPFHFLSLVVLVLNILCLPLSGADES